MAAPVANRVTLSDVARVSGVSRMAVARVLLGSGQKHVRVSEGTAERVRRVARQIGYQPNLVAQQLAGRRSGLIGVIIDSYAPMLRSTGLATVERQASARGYRLIVGQVHDDVEGLAEYVSDFSGRGVEGVVFISHRYPQGTPYLMDLVRQLPHVVFLGRPEDVQADYVEADTAAGISMALEHLLDRGRKRFGLAMANVDFPSNAARRAAFEEGLRERGIAAPAERIWVGHHVGAPPPHLMDRLVEELIVGQRPDAVLVQNDAWAVRLIKALKKRGIRVPEDVAIVGYDNEEIAEIVEPGLTTVDPRMHEVSRQLIDLLLDRIENSGNAVPASRLVVEPQLVVRESS